MNLDVLSKNENQGITSRVKKLISQIGDLINHKHLQPGDKLPAERILAENSKLGPKKTKPLKEN